jgi:hypothetical protein
MEGKIKKFFINFIWTKKQLISAVLFCLFLGLTLPFQFAQAWGWGNIFGGILGVIMSIPINFLAIMLQVLLAVSNVVVALAGLILNWVISPYFMSMPYTEGGIVDVGWPLVRDLVNMFFIVALVIIGLATALRIKEYQAQKALPRLIIIAILINFTPVICGLIMDAQNIFMNFFLEEMGGFKIILNLFGEQGSSVIQAISHFFDISYASGFLGKTIAMIAFDWIAALIFFMYAILFIMRYIMIWVLVIVSPLAFFSKVFPGTEKYFFKSILGWDEWWKQFIEWSMIGIIGAFFLYLGEQLIVHMPPQITAGIPPAGTLGIITAPFVEFINNLLPYGVVLAFLIIGFFTATSTSAMGAGAITSFFKEQGMAIGKTAMFPFQRAGTRLIAGTAERLARTWELTGGRVTGKIPILGKPLQRGVEAVAVAPLRRYAARARRIDFDEMFKGMEAGEMAEQAGTLLAKPDRVAAAAWMAEKGFLDKVPGKSVPVLDEKGNPIPLLDEEGKQMIDPETGKPLFKTETINPFHDQMAKEATDLAEKPEYRKSATDVLETLSGKVTEKVSLKLETDPTAKAKLKIEIGKIADEISKDEKIKVEIEARAKEEGISFEQAARDMAARQIWTGALKSGDVKDMAKSSFDDAGVRRGTEMWHSGQWQALMNNFKKPVVDKTLNEPGGLNYMVRKEGTAFLEQFADKNSRGFNFFARSPAGREWNFEGLKYMLDPEGRPTTRVDDFERRRRIKEILTKSPSIIQSFYKLHTTAARHQRRIEELQMRGQPTAQREKLLESTLQQIASQWPRIEKSEPLRKNWLEIEKMRNPDQARVLQRDVEAGLRIEGILKNYPKLSLYDDSQQAVNTIEQQLEAAKKLRKPKDELTQLEEAQKMARAQRERIEKEVQKDDVLREKWEEIERLRRPPKPPRRRGPRRGGRPPRGGRPSPRGGPGGGPTPGAGPTPSPPGAPTPPTPPPRVPRPPRPTPAPPPTAATAPAPEEEGLTPEEIALEAVKGALEETRREQKREEGRGRKGR